MKKLVLIVLVSLSMIYTSIQVSADTSIKTPETTSETKSGLYTVTVNSCEEYYNAIKSALEKFESNINISTNNYNEKVYDISVVNKVIKENPLIDYGFVRVNSKIAKSLDGKSANINIIFTYSRTSSEMLMMKEKAKEKAVQIINNIIKTGMDVWEKELVIHDYIVNNSSYDKYNYDKNTVPPESYTDYGVLINKKGVCEGYAKAFMRLANQAGIECIYVSGDAEGEGHAWNIVKIEGQYYHIDTTFDDPIVSNGQNTLFHDFYNLTDIEISRNHNWDKITYPQCNSTTYSYSNVQRLLKNKYMTEPLSVKYNTGEIEVTFKDFPTDFNSRSFTVVCINNGKHEKVLISQVGWNPNTGIAYIKVPSIVSSSIDQKVFYKVSYKDIYSASTKEFTIMSCKPISSRITEKDIKSSGLEVINSKKGDYLLEDIAYSQELGLFVAVGRYGVIQVSRDTTTWTLVDSSTNEDLFGVAYDGVQFISVGANETILKSADGYKWERVNAIYKVGKSVFKYSGGLSSISYNKGTYIATGAFGYIFKSIDCVTWTAVGGEKTKDIYSIVSVTSNGDSYVAVGGDWLENNPSYILYSKDGNDWSKMHQTGTYLTRVKWVKDKYVAVGNYGTILISYDGKRWEDKSYKTSMNLFDVDYFGQKIIVVGSGIIITSSDATNWIEKVSDLKIDIKALATGNGDCVAVGDGNLILSTQNADQWVNIKNKKPNSIRSVATDGKNYVAVGYQLSNHGNSYLGEDAYISVSDNAIDWHRISLNLGLSKHQIIQDVIWGNNEYVAVGFNDLIMKSEDGVEWEKVEAKDLGSYNKIIYDGHKYIAVGVDSIVTSLNGYIWNRASNTKGVLYNITYNGDRYVAVGENKIYYSDDGYNWAEVKDFSPGYLISISWNGEKYIGAGFDSIVTSYDGISWNTIKINKTDLPTNYYVNNDGKKFIISCGGTLYGSDIILLTSDTGVNWDKIKLSTGQTISRVIVCNKRIILCGENNTIINIFDKKN